MTEIDIQPEDQVVFERLKSTGRITHTLRRLITQQWNVCSVCDHFIFPGRPAFAGYNQDKVAIYVGACCEALLSELATPCYWRSNMDLRVPNEQPLWRYMDFSKFTAMLRQRGLYFPRADQLGDRFEGAIGLARRESDWDEFYLKFFRQAVTTPPPGYDATDLTPEEIEGEANRLLRDFKAGARISRNTLVSCWHANTIESEALWRLYCPPPMMGVSIQTTVSRLWDATNTDESAVVGRVRYLDFRNAFSGNDRERIFCKRASLSHEMEVRAALQNDIQRPAESKLLACNLEELIEVVVISPFAPDWFSDVVSDVIERFGYSLRVRSSELKEEPFF